jgi:TP901 family phage tail tape measure protein
MMGAGESLSKFALTAGAVGVGIGALTGVITTAGFAAAKFGKESIALSRRLAEVNTLLGLSKSGMSVLKREILDVSAEMGFLTEDSVPALYQAISASVPRDNVIDFIKVAGDAAIGGVTTLETSVDGLTSVINAYGVAIQDAEMVSDLFFQTVKRGKTTFDDLSENIGKVAPLSKAAGVEMKEMFGIIAALTKQGVKTEIAMTGLRSILSQMLSPSKELTNHFEDMKAAGLETDVTTAGLVKVLRDLSDSVGGDNKALAKLLPNVRGLNAIFALLDKNAKIVTEDIKAMDKAMGSSAEAAKTMKDDVSQAARTLAADFEQLKLNIGEVVTDTGIVQFLAKVGKQLNIVTSRLARQKGGLLFGSIFGKLAGGKFSGAVGLRARGINEAVEKLAEGVTGAFSKATGKADVNKLLPTDDFAEIVQLSQDLNRRNEAQDKIAAVRKKNAATAQKKTFMERLKGLKQELSISKLIADGKDKEAFIQQKIASFGKLTVDQQKEVAALAGNLFGARKPKEEEEMFSGPALSEAIRAGTQAEAGLLARAMVPESEKKLLKKNVDANVATANELKIQNERGVKVRGMKVVNSVQ